MLKLEKQLLRFLTINKIKPNNLKENAKILKFLRDHFVEDEPLCKSLKLSESKNDKMVGLNYYFSYLLDSGNVCKIEDSGKIIATAMCSLKERQDSKGVPEVDDPLYQKLCNLFNHMEIKADVFNRFDIDKHYYIDVIGVHKDYRKLGLLYRLLEESEKMGKSVGCTYLTCLVTGAFSKGVCAKFGMEEIVQLEYKNYKVNGEIVFNTEFPHVDTVYYAKCI